MPFTQSQILDIKALFKEGVKDIFENTKFVGHITNLIAKSIDKKFDNRYSKNLYCEMCGTKRENMMLKSRINKMEQYTRRNSVRIFGIPDKYDENIQAIVLNLCKDKLNVDLTAPRIDRVHRIGPWRTQEKKRGIILKLTNHWYKEILLRNRYKLKGRGHEYSPVKILHNLDAIYINIRNKNVV
ncbi:hypothetical protein QE152_g4946 [Popillia japonica]|uniref:Uncharacterized protein n=1 Tax=Popillia japonica TaxID=7064 RepID=A0AAW1MZL2_POPJA